MFDAKRRMLHIAERREAMLHRHAKFFDEALCGIAAKHEAALTRHEAFYGCAAKYEAKPNGFIFFCPPGKKKEQMIRGLSKFA